ncbi:hypothetical protein PC129_g13762 [Phytophthora cactorum]|uniref:Uncharacterized protein n=1 Tax=Phytophthora cactorum TaxID=29920 RepID=A0A8T1BI50_9STRA|nr:hypothetical protein PC115_g15047 [Phytophthora cactorum]KAG3148382.1 hypothetical protein C6341_g17428 [Phytophthora cactorum]KAG3173596.1 hypothetical protein PC128_g18241 [Phytophthora cactorum]KAG3215362.1 hypothetical protein PC129_g13762 [Phytophthora cactorum]
MGQYLAFIFQRTSVDEDYTPDVHTFRRRQYAPCNLANSMLLLNESIYIVGI